MADTIELSYDDPAPDDLALARRAVAGGSRLRRRRHVGSAVGVAAAVGLVAGVAALAGGLDRAAAPRVDRVTIMATPRVASTSSQAAPPVTYTGAPPADRSAVLPSDAVRTGVETVSSVQGFQPPPPATPGSVSRFHGEEVLWFSTTADGRQVRLELGILAQGDTRRALPVLVLTGTVAPHATAASGLSVGQAVIGQTVDDAGPYGTWGWYRGNRAAVRDDRGRPVVARAAPGRPGIYVFAGPTATSHQRLGLLAPDGTVAATGPVVN